MEIKDSARSRAKLKNKEHSKTLKTLKQNMWTTHPLLRKMNTDIFKMLNITRPRRQSMILVLLTRRPSLTIPLSNLNSKSKFRIKSKHLHHHQRQRRYQFSRHHLKYNNSQGKSLIMTQFIMTTTVSSTMMMSMQTCIIMTTHNMTNSIHSHQYKVIMTLAG